MDPLAPEYAELTPYQFASNTPIAGIDLDGLEILVFSSTTIPNSGYFTVPRLFLPNASSIKGVQSGVGTLHYRGGGLDMFPENRQNNKEIRKFSAENTTPDTKSQFKGDKTTIVRPTTKGKQETTPGGKFFFGEATNRDGSSHIFWGVETADGTRHLYHVKMVSEQDNTAKVGTFNIKAWEKSIVPDKTFEMDVTGKEAENLLAASEKFLNKTKTYDIKEFSCVSEPLRVLQDCDVGIDYTFGSNNYYHVEKPRNAKPTENQKTDNANKNVTNAIKWFENGSKTRPSDPSKPSGP